MANDNGKEGYIPMTDYLECDKCGHSMNPHITYNCTCICHKVKGK